MPSDAAGRGLTSHLDELAELDLEGPCSECLQEVLGEYYRQVAERAERSRLRDRDDAGRLQATPASRLCDALELIASLGEPKALAASMTRADVACAAAAFKWLGEFRIALEGPVIPATDPAPRATVITAMHSTPPQDLTSSEVCAKCGEVHERCAAHKKSTGKPCTQHAIVGGNVCRFHGGGAPQVRAKANTRLEELRRAGEVGKLLAEFGDQEARHPLDALLDRHDEADSMVRLLRLAVAGLTVKPAPPAPAIDSAGSSGPDTPAATVGSSLYGPDHTGDGAPHVLVEMLGTWVDRHTRVAKVLLDHDVDQRKLRLESARREAVFEAFMRAAEATFADEAQRRRFGEELARALQAGLADGAPVDAIEVGAA